MQSNCTAHVIADKLAVSFTKLIPYPCAHSHSNVCSKRSTYDHPDSHSVSSSNHSPISFPVQEAFNRTVSATYTGTWRNT